MATQSRTKAQVTRRFDAAPERVFDAWVNPEIASAWLFTSPDSDPAGRQVTIEPRVGGAWTISDRREGQDFTADGEYLEIDRPRRLVFTFRMAQFSDTVDTVAIDITPLDQGCELTLTQEITIPHEDNVPSDDVNTMLSEFTKATEQGWNGMFDQLETQVV